MSIFNIAIPMIPSPLTVPFYVQRGQSDQIDYNSFQRNYSIVLPYGDAFGCDRSRIPVAGPPAERYGPRGKMLWQIGFPIQCEQFLRLQILIDYGYAGAILASPLPYNIASNLQSGMITTPNQPPFTYPEHWAPTGTDPLETPFNQLVLTSYLIAFSPNATVTLGFPDPNPMYVHVLYVWGWSSIFAGLGFAINVFALMVCAAKMYVFVMFSKWNSLPVYALSISLFGLILNFVQIYSQLGNNGSVPHSADGAIFEHWPWTACFCVGFIIGFYLIDVSMLTGAPQSKSGVFSLMRWPCFGLCVFSAIVVIIIPAVDIAGIPYNNAAYPFTPEQVNFPSECQIPYVQFYISIQLITMFVVNVVLVWGLISLWLAATGMSDENKRSLIRMTTLCCIALVVLDITCILWYLGRYCGGTPLIFPAVTQTAAVQIIVFCVQFGPCMILLSFALCFEYRTSKEIEISKSATSSTSGSGSSSQSSSSSSSKSESAVIEL